MKKLNWFQEHIYYPLYRTWNKITDIPTNIKEYHHRGKHGWAESDAWSVDNHLVKIIPPMLRQMADANNSYPGRYPYDTAKKWQKALLLAADDIEASDKFDDEHLPKGFGSDDAVTQQYLKDKKKAYERTLKGMKFVAKNFFDLWD